DDPRCQQRGRRTLAPLQQASQPGVQGEDDVGQDRRPQQRAHKPAEDLGKLIEQNKQDSEETDSEQLLARHPERLAYTVSSSNRVKRRLASGCRTACEGEGGMVTVRNNGVSLPLGWREAARNGTDRCWWRTRWQGVGRMQVSHAASSCGLPIE